GDRVSDVLGMHFFSPANIMKLLEIVRAEKASPEALTTALAVGKKLGKTPVVAGVCDGFIGNRIYNVYRREAIFLMEEGASP
ncbi:MAG TPA: 3-hydroxyacyl-CoA dehydrogenase, partial [Rhodospirillaceae bacterium]|nr:3-hydroxyacyl-CoA dehydrogenase [Rhodospirillaceae bacterium]